MIIYLQIFLLFVFSVVMSAAIGFVIYLAVDKVSPSTMIRHTLGVGASVLTGYFITELLIFSGIWYYYVATIVLGIMLYVLFVKLLGEHFK